MSALLRLTNVLPLAQDSAAAGQGLTFSWTVTVANLVAAVAVVVSAAAIWATWRRDVRLREIEYADRVKTAAASTLAHLERAREISLHFFDVFSRSFVSASEKMQGGAKTPVQIKNFVWKVAERAAAERNNRLLEEKIELAYVDLYAYDRKIHDLFAAARTQQETVWTRVIGDVKLWTQDDILKFRAGADGLREDLRQSVNVLREELRHEFDDIVHPLRDRLETWIRADEKTIVRRELQLTPSGNASTSPSDPAGVAGAALRAFVLGSRSRRSHPGTEADRHFARLYRRFEVLGESWPRLITSADRLYQRPDSRARQKQLGELLARIHADEQPEVKAVAAKLLEVLGKSGADGGQPSADSRDPA